MSKHTPGPWFTNGFHVFRAKNGSQDVASNIANRADARLIAAAPEMLEALKAALSMDSPIDRYENAKLFKQIEAAIAKAEGRRK